MNHWRVAVRKARCAGPSASKQAQDCTILLTDISGPPEEEGFLNRIAEKQLPTAQVWVWLSVKYVFTHSMFNRLYNRPWNVLEVGVEDMLACVWVCTRAGYGVREREGSYATEVRESLSLRESLSRNKGTCHWEAWKQMPRQMLDSAKTKPERLNEGDDVLTMVILETESTDMAGEIRNREVLNPWNGDSAIASWVSSCLRVLVHNHRVGSMTASQFPRSHWEDGWANAEGILSELWYIY